MVTISEYNNTAATERVENNKIVIINIIMLGMIERFIVLLEIIFYLDCNLNDENTRP